ncbi:MAG: tetratricopeptide repeat protein, partial [Methanothrix sp.]|nr:tetratricopeptide repeat protein [Methanothrix sp.]
WTAAQENYSSSIEGFEKAGDAQSQASVLSNLASISYKRGEWAQALESYQESLDLFEKMDDQSGIACVLSNLGNFYYRRGERSLALEHFQRGLSVLKSQRDLEGAMEMQASIDMIKASRGDMLPSVEDYQKQLMKLKEAGDLSGQAEVLGAIGSAYVDRCLWDKALSAYKDSLELFEQVGEIYSQAETIFNMALVHKDKGDLAKAIQLFEMCQKIFQNLNAVPRIALTMLNLGAILGIKGQCIDAEKLFCEALKILEALGAIPDLCEGYLTFAIYQIHLGRPHEARFYLSQAQTLIQSIDYQPLNIQFHNAQGELFLKEGLYIEAESSLEKGLALARRHSNLYEEAKACANLGRLAMAKMDNREAMDKLKLALATFSRIGAMFDVITIYHDLAGLFLGQEDYVRAEETAVLELRYAKLLGYPDLCIKALTDLADCEAHTGRVREAKSDYAFALRLAREKSDTVPLSTRQSLLCKLIDFLETARTCDEEDILLGNMREKLQKGNYGEVLEELSGPLECKKTL